MNDVSLTAAFALLGSALTAYLATPAVGALARRFGLLDRPGGRKAHAAPVPRLGGAALFLGFTVGTLVYGAAFGWDRLARVFTGESFLVLLVPAGFVFAVGVVDDLRGLGPAPRVVAELLAAGVLLQSGYVIDVVANPFGLPVDLGLLSIPLTLLWFVGVTNAFNLVDGMDGLMAVLGIAALGGAAGVAFLQGQTGTGVLCLALCGSLLGFLRWNWFPARIFLGDSGSLLVGFTVAALTLKVARNSAGVLNFHVPLALAAIPIGETLLTLARRYVNGQAYFSGDASHIHHVLLKSGIGVPRAVGILGLLAALFAAVGVVSLSWRGEGSAAAIVILLAIIALGVRKLRYVEVRVLADRVRHSLFRPRRRGLTELTALARAGERIRESRTPEELGAHLRQACAEAGFGFLALELAGDAVPSFGPPTPPVDVLDGVARTYLAGRRGGPSWVFAAGDADRVPAPAAEGERAPRPRTVTFVETPLPPGDGRLGRLLWMRYTDPARSGPSIADIAKYLVDPLGEALDRLLPSAAPARGGEFPRVPPRGTPAPVTP